MKARRRAKAAHVVTTYAEYIDRRYAARTNDGEIMCRRRKENCDFLNEVPKRSSRLTTLFVRDKHLGLHKNAQEVNYVGHYF